ncbi:MAG: hypothetical protein AB1461_17990 [Thermodesulfobacteriota bacterium]
MGKAEKMEGPDRECLDLEERIIIIYYIFLEKSSVFMEESMHRPEDRGLRAGKIAGSGIYAPAAERPRPGIHSRDDTSGTSHARYGCRESFTPTGHTYETVTNLFIINFMKDNCNALPKMRIYLF